MMNNDVTKQYRNSKLYPVHGRSKSPIGIIAKVNGMPAIVQYRGNDLTGYTTLEELTRMMYKMEDSLPSIEFRE